MIKTPSSIYKFVCSKYPQLRKKKPLGKGTEGTVYVHCIEGNCNYVVKIQDQLSNEELKILQKEQMKTNLVNKLTHFAPKIYTITRCPTYQKIATVMDRIKGTTLYNTALTTDVIDDVFDLITKLHSHDIYHGDLNPSNIIYKDGKLYLIDFNIRTEDYKLYYDYLTFLYFLPSLFDIEYDDSKENKKLMYYFYSRIYYIVDQYDDQPWLKSNLKKLLEYFYIYDKKELLYALDLVAKNTVKYIYDPYRV
jgi:tRNA A-37 threonylcarbamoyl transferase component Bud32